jgi:small-conductance mechanosensitive channel
MKRSTLNKGFKWLFLFYLEFLAALFVAIRISFVFVYLCARLHGPYSESGKLVVIAMGFLLCFSLFLLYSYVRLSERPSIKSFRAALLSVFRRKEKPAIK